MNGEIKEFLIGLGIGVLIGASILMMFTLFSCTTVQSYCKKQCTDRGETHVLKTDNMVCNCNGKN